MDEVAPGGYPLATPPVSRGPLQRFLRAPLLHLAVYYTVLVVLAVVLIREFEVVREALVSPVVPVVDEGSALLGEGSREDWTPAPLHAVGAADRAVTTLLVSLGAISLAIPVAWVYMLTKRLRYDPGLVRSIIILPIAVAGILLVVKNSLALAFSLAGIVAAVRFRNTLKDPQDAVYIFLTIAIGLSAGVQALDVAVVVSLTFNIVVLTLWKLQVGSIYAGRYQQTGVLSIGDFSLLVARTPEARRAIRRQVLEDEGEMKADGVLLVHTAEPELAPQTVQDALSEIAQDWRLTGITNRGEDVHTATYLVQLAKDETPVDLIGALDAWSAHISGAEYIPVRRRGRLRDDPEAEDRP